jgi:hypothetical protein
MALDLSVERLPGFRRQSGRYARWRDADRFFSIGCIQFRMAGEVFLGAEIER